MVQIMQCNAKNDRNFLLQFCGVQMEEFCYIAGPSIVLKRTLCDLRDLQLNNVKTVETQAGIVILKYHNLRCILTKIAQQMTASSINRSCPQNMQPKNLNNFYLKHILHFEICRSYERNRLGWDTLYTQYVLAQVLVKKNVAKLEHPE